MARTLDMVHIRLSEPGNASLTVSLCKVIVGDINAVLLYYFTKHHKHVKSCSIGRDEWNASVQSCKDLLKTIPNNIINNYFVIPAREVPPVREWNGECKEKEKVKY